MTTDGRPRQVVRVALELWREQGHLVAQVRSAEPSHDYGVMALHELALLLEAVAAESDL